MVKIWSVKSKQNQNSRTSKQNKSESLSSEFPFQIQTSIPGTYGKDFFALVQFSFLSLSTIT